MGELVEALISTGKFSLIASILFSQTSCANPLNLSISTQVLLTCICKFIIELLGRVYLNIDPFLDSLGPYDWIFIDVRRNSI